MATNIPAGQKPRDAVEEAPPFLGTWPRVYGAILIYLAALIIGLAIASRVFSA